MLRTEAAPVVRHRDLDEGAPAAQHDRDPPGLAVLAHVRQCLLDDAEEHDLLRIAQTGQVALGPGIDLDAGRVLERAQLGLHCIRHGAGDGRRRADGVRDLAQALVEGAEPSVDVVEAPAHALPEIVGNDRRNLRRRGTQLVGQRDELLQRPVVQVEAETHDAPLAGSHEVVLALHSPVEKGCPLEKRCQRVRSFLEVLLEMLRLGDPSARHERGVRAVPTLDDPDVHLGRADDDSVERGARRLPQPAAARRLAVRDETGRGAGGVEDPEGAGSGRCELDQQGERQLGGDHRGKLGELLARESAPEDCERRSLGRQAELVGRDRDHRARLAGLEPVLDGDRDDRIAEEVECGPLTPPLGQAPRPHLAGTKRSTQVAWKERRVGRPWLSGSDRRRTGDQFGGKGRTDRGDPPVRRSFHSFHNCILRSMNVLNNGTLGPTGDHRPERSWKGRPPQF